MPAAQDHNGPDTPPDHLTSTVTSRIRTAHHADSALVAEAQLQALAQELERKPQGWLSSVREGQAETLTVPPERVARRGPPCDRPTASKL